MSLVPHILHVFSTFDPGGAQIRMAGIMNALGSRFSHTIIAMDGNLGAAGRLGSHVQVNFLEPPRRKNSLLCLLAFREVLQKLRPALLLTYNWGAIEAVIGGHIAATCPIIHQEHGFGPDEATALKRRRVLTRHLILNRIYTTIVPSRTLLKIALTSYRLRPSKVKLIHNGVDVDRFQPRRDPEFRQHLGIADDTVLFGYVGNLRKEKNLALLLRAFQAAQLENARLAIIGDGPCLAGLKRLAHDLGLGNRVIFAGSTEDPAGYYSVLDVLVMSSMTEQMPMSLLEAMACGLPALCTNVGDSADLLGASQPPVVVPSGDVEAYAESLRVLARRPDLRSDLGARNRYSCVAQYSLDRMATEYANLYHAAVVGC